MIYYKIKVTLKKLGKNINRTFLVDPKTSLEEFGVKVLSTFNICFEHAFYFKGVDKDYVPDDWIDMFEDPNMTPLAWYTVIGIQLDEKLTFRLIYDTGEGYEFECKVNKKPVYDDLEENMKLISGNGYGVFEDNIPLFKAFLKGATLRNIILKEMMLDNVTLPETDEDYYEYMPMNIDLSLDTTLDEFYDDLDIESYQDQMELDSYLYFNESN